MKTILILTTFLLNQFVLLGQTETTKLIDKSNAIENLIPNKWKILSIAHGDLNNDGISDVAFIIENTDSKNIQSNESGLGRVLINLNPRILGIYFRNEKGLLVKKTQSNNFIILQDSPTMDEPFDGMEILNDGILKIDFKFWYSAGSWNMSNHTYKFKFQSDNFELIKYEAYERHRGTGESTDYKVDFLSSQIEIITTTIDENEVEKTIPKTIKFEIDKLKSIQSLGKPFEWEFNGIYL